MTTPILKALAELEDTDNRAKKWADKEYDPEKFKGPFKHHDIRYTYARGAASMRPAVESVKVLVEALEKLHERAELYNQHVNAQLFGVDVELTTRESLADAARILSEGKT